VNNKRHPAPALTPAMVTAVVSPDVEHPLDLSPMHTVRRDLAVRAYSVDGLESAVAIESKSLGELLSCVGQNRRQFRTVVDRLLTRQTRALVVTSSWTALESGEWTPRVTPASA